MKRKSVKTPRKFNKVEEPVGDSPAEPSSSQEATLQEFGGFKVGETVYYNILLVGVKYSSGIIKKIVSQSSGTVVFMIWDTTKRMWRAFLHDKVFKEKPHVPRKRIK